MYLNQTKRILKSCRDIEANIRKLKAEPTEEAQIKCRKLERKYMIISNLLQQIDKNESSLLVGVYFRGKRLNDVLLPYKANYGVREQLLYYGTLDISRAIDNLKDSDRYFLINNS